MNEHPPFKQVFTLTLLTNGVKGNLYFDSRQAAERYAKHAMLTGEIILASNVNRMYSYNEATPAYLMQTLPAYEEFCKQQARPGDTLNKNQTIQTYELVTSKSGQPGIHCFTCNMTSYNPGDIENKWCEKCKKIHV